MGEVISFSERKVKAKGLDVTKFPNEDKIKSYIFSGDYDKIQLLNEFSVPPLKSKSIKLFYPGCGVDILFPLIYLDKLFPEINEAKLAFVDTENTLGLIKPVLDEVGIHFSEKGNQISFYWNNKLISLKFITGNVFKILDEIKDYDVYFEKAFRIMREKVPDYEEKVVKNLASGGILISDSGFSNTNLKNLNVSKELSTYGEMFIGVKD